MPWRRESSLPFMASSSLSSVQLLTRAQLFVTPWTAARQASLTIINSRSLLKLMSTESGMPYNHPILCCPLRLLLSIFPSIRVSSNESALRIRWPKYWSFSFIISPSNEHPGLISFRMDCLDLLAVQGPLKSLLQHHSSKASILRRSAFFMVQLSHPCMTTGKTIALPRWTFFFNIYFLYWGEGVENKVAPILGPIHSLRQDGGCEGHSHFTSSLLPITTYKATTPGFFQTTFISSVFLNPMEQEAATE